MFALSSYLLVGSLLFILVDVALFYIINHKILNERTDVSQFDLAELTGIFFTL